MTLSEIMWMVAAIVGWLMALLNLAFAEGWHKNAVDWRKTYELANQNIRRSLTILLNAGLITQGDFDEYVNTDPNGSPQRGAGEGPANQNGPDAA
jgi:hypothetical protein